MMISNPNTLNGDTLLPKQNGNLHNDEIDEKQEQDEENSDYDQLDQINTLKKKLLENGLVNNLKRSLSEQQQQQQQENEIFENKKIKKENLIEPKSVVQLPEKIMKQKNLNFLKLKQLEQNLRNEETKFILLKRLFYSQKSAPIQRVAANGGQVKPQAPIKPGQQPSQQVKQPLNQVNTKQQIPPQQQPKPQQQTRPQTTPVTNQIQNSASSSSLNKQHINRINNNNSPLINKNPSPSPSSAFSPTVVPTEPKKPNAQTHVLVNQLVRKEFEKSLQQLEFPPKNPNLTPSQQQQLFQDIYFLPNANSPDFLMCLGLEEVVRCVQEHLNNKQQYKEQKEKKENLQQETDDKDVNKIQNQIEIRYEFPYFCAQCSTDWTPVWRTDKNGIVLCEKCLKQLEKKQIKQEHSAKLKQLFIKAQKDKEIFEKQVLSEQNNSQTQSQPQVQQQAQQQQQQQQQQQIHKPIVNHQSSTPKPMVNHNNRPNQSTPNNTKQFVPSNRPSPIAAAAAATNHSRPSPIQQKPQNSSNPSNRPNQNPNQLRNVQNVKPNPQKEQQMNLQQRQRASATGGANLGMNFNSALLGQNSKTSVNNVANLNNLSSQFNFSNSTAALAALAQQQQQAALLQQLFQNQQQNNLFNLSSLSSPAAALNYLNMLSSPANQTNGKQWKNS
ncbi:unnamed protein product [Brachionus calyciflorus]|uniref:GATA-type domain-containing protein n=1 Tax=Brachionus calyciflorus TaxID=104777 RepID=A0A813ZSW7_9BILA|nr:unnamed protein product [Brachionus calyciflorus]